MAVIGDMFMVLENFSSIFMVLKHIGVINKIFGVLARWKLSGIFLGYDIFGCYNTWEILATSSNSNLCKLPFMLCSSDCTLPSLTWHILSWIFKIHLHKAVDGYGHCQKVFVPSLQLFIMQFTVSLLRSLKKVLHGLFIFHFTGHVLWQPLKHHFFCL